MTIRDLMGELYKIKNKESEIKIVKYEEEIWKTEMKLIGVQADFEEFYTYFVCMEVE